MSYSQATLHMEDVVLQWSLWILNPANSNDTQVLSFLPYPHSVFTSCMCKGYPGTTEVNLSALLNLTCCEKKKSNATPVV